MQEQCYSLGAFVHRGRSTSRATEIAQLLTSIWVVALTAMTACRVDEPRYEKVNVEDLTIVDGDTIRHHSRACRILGYDAPEPPATWFAGDQEPWARSATQELRRQLMKARVVEIAWAREGDKYDRGLCQVRVDGVPVGAALLRMGLAYETITRYGHGGFIEDAEILLQASREGGKPDFIDPHSWRRMYSTEPRED